MSRSWKSFGAGGADVPFAKTCARAVRRLYGLDHPRAHWIAFKLVRLAWGVAGLSPIMARLPRLPVSVMGLDFPNPIGLAAGFDKDAALAGCLEVGGFGFVESGTVKPLPEPGKSRGVAVMQVNLERKLTRRAHLPLGQARQLLGISLGSNHEAWRETAITDYLALMNALWRYADYLVINLSSPRDRDGMTRAHETPVRRLLERIRDHARELGATTGKQVPVAVKVAVTANQRNVPMTVQCVAEAGLQGIVAATEQTQPQAAICRQLRALSDYLGTLPLISVGGIGSVDDARKRMESGAALVQLFTGVLREGPFLARRIVAGLGQRQPDIGQ